MTLPLNEPRCIGLGAGPSGHGIADACLACRRRTATRAGVQFLAPPVSLPCPNRMGPPLLHPMGSMGEPWEHEQGEAS